MTTYIEDEETYSASDHKVTTIAEEPEGCKFRHVLQCSSKYVASSIVEMHDHDKFDRNFIHVHVCGRIMLIHVK